MELRLSNNVKYILDKLNDHGYEAYIVGGCVRDSIIGAVPHDWDICTSALPEQVAEVFSDNRIIPTGLQHGTITIIIDNEQYEVTTYRIDGKYEDNRHPSEVSFTKKLKEDLKRRDFTINAMAYNPSTGVIDFFGGRKDIRDCVIRCVGNPNDRFNEDALRMLRAVRFSITLGYEIESRTLGAIRANKKLLNNISVERINSEITKALSEGYSTELGELIQVVVPEMSNTMISNAKTMVGFFNASLYVRLALVFNFDEDKQKEILQRLRFDNKTIKNVCNIHKLVYKIRDFNIDDLVPEILTKQILRYDDTIAEDVISCLKCSSYLDGGLKYYTLAGDLNNCLPKCKNQCYSLSHLKVNGDDIKELGFSGEEVGKILNSLLIDVITGAIENDHNSLLEYVKKIFFTKIQ